MRLLNEDRKPVEDMKINEVNKFTRHDPVCRFLAETKEPCVRIQEEREARAEREALDGPKPDILSKTCSKCLSNVTLREPNNMTTRRTRLDLLLNYIFEKTDPAFSDELTLHTDLEFNCRLPCAGKSYSLGGTPYYSLWYGPVEDLATNFVAVHTETPGVFDEAVVHAYMGMIHDSRKRCGKMSREIYGLATDSNEFWFYRIDNTGKWSHTVYQASKSEWGELGDDYEDIASLLVFIFREACELLEQNDTSGKLSLSRLKVNRLPFPFQGTEEVSYERLKAMPEGLDTWIN
ncbi:hypothetical protein N7478_003183 [Penicillium angulare]|uniref:uncharacterized protein n=1 Tax=Penicillium angulare TaxID=116970 RepID=UPI00253F7DD7|nr:uncharacterized protein N7478_003183 [Penicillium angulare]KAJ5287497.1 hypothetical protein N7478_003183 [Penicillium angulare]